MSKFYVERIERYEVEADNIEQARQAFNKQFNNIESDIEFLDFEYVDGGDTFEEVN